MNAFINECEVIRIELYKKKTNIRIKNNTKEKINLKPKERLNVERENVKKIWTFKMNKSTRKVDKSHIKRN